MASWPSGAVAVTLSKQERIQRKQRAHPSLRGLRVSSRIDPSPVAPYPNERAAHSTTSAAVPEPESAAASRCVRWWLHRVAALGSGRSTTAYSVSAAISVTANMAGETWETLANSTSRAPSLAVVEAGRRAGPFYQRRCPESREGAGVAPRIVVFPVRRINTTPQETQ